MRSRVVSAHASLSLLFVTLLIVSFAHSQVFSPISNMPATRSGAAAVQLQDGTVLVAGGFSGGNVVATALIYDPNTKTFSATKGNMTKARAGHRAVVLLNGKVLILGPDATAELYDPDKGTFSTTGSMTTARDLPTATLLGDGTVLVAGGQQTGHAELQSAELYDPDAGQFSATGNMVYARSNNTATLLIDGSVLVAGGWIPGGWTQHAEIYAPRSRAFTPVGDMKAVRYGHSATLLPNGKVLIAGGWGGSGVALSSAEIYDPATISFSTTGSLHTARVFHTATPLFDGTVLIAGGWGTSPLSSAEIYSPTPKTFSTTGGMTASYDTATLLNDGTVLVASGTSGSNAEVATAEVYSYPFTGGTITPKYVVLGVIYAPPGARSSVSYSQSTALGTSSSISSTFIDSTQVTASIGISLKGPWHKITGGSLSGSVSKTWTEQADTQSTYSLNQTKTAGLGANGPLSSAIGVDHDYDTILVWLNPKVNLSVGDVPSLLLWNGNAFDPADPYFSSDPDIVQLSLFCLKNPFFAPGCTDNNYRTSRPWDTSGLGGLTLDDYEAIARRDPFYVDPLYDPNNDPNNRFTNTSQIVDYTPAPPGGGPYNWTGGWSYVATSSQGQSASDSYQVQYTIDASLCVVICGSLKDQHTTTWKNGWSTTQTTTVGQTATYNIFGPVATDNYSGPTGFQLWQDNIYGTFMFVAPGTVPTTPGSIGVSPSALQFGPVPVGSVSSPLQVQLTNNSVLPMFMGNPSAFPFNGQTQALSPVWAFSDPAFSVVVGSDTCTGHIVSPNATCILSVQYTPTVSGTVNATMYLTGVTDAVVLAKVPVSETTSQNSTTTSLTSSPNPSQAGQAVTFTATVASSMGAPPNGEAITFMNGSTSIGTATLNAGVAALTTSSLPQGTDPITAVYGGDSNFLGSTSNVVNQVVGVATTTTTLTSSPNPSSYGSQVTFTATVTSSTGGTPSGTVTFKNGATTLATKTLSSGVATYKTSALPLGSNSITAVYNGDSNNSGSTSAPLIQVVLAATTTTIASSPNPSAYGQAVTFTATVSSVSGAPPNGETVSFMKGTTVLGTGALSGGTASFTTSTLAVGNNNVKAVYGGDSNFGSSTSTALTQVVNAATTTTSISSSVNPSQAGQSVTFTATVTAQFGGTVTGTVTFYDGSTALQTKSLSGNVATYTTSTLTSGSHTITATYNGSAKYSGSSGSLTQQVN